MTADAAANSSSSLHGISLEQLARILGGVVQGGEVRARGPGHSHGNPEMSIKLDATAPDGFVVYSFAGDDINKCRDYIRQKVGASPWRPSHKGKAQPSSSGTAQQQTGQQQQQQQQQSIVRYEYQLADGRPYLLVVRKPNKKFGQMRWDTTLLRNGKPKGWVNGAPKGPKIPYLLPKLIAHDKTNPVFVCEGEKDVDALAKLGFTATTNSEGAGKWTVDLDQWFAGHTVYILADNDEPGARHAANVAEHLRAVADAVKVVNLPGLPDKGDVSDWLNAGNDPATLIDLCLSHKGAKIKIAPEFSEEALALKFADRHADELRYVAAWDRWMIYDGAAWRQDDRLRTFTWAREICREAANICDNDRTKTILASYKTVAAVVQLARSDERLAASVDQWDRDIWLLNTPDGAIDLRNGELRPHAVDDYMTKTTAVSPAPPGTAHPLFDQFLNRSANGDIDLINYLKRLFGYALTGSTQEETLEFFWGEGGNGKSVLLRTISSIIGDYATVAPIEVFTASGFDRHPTELAGLRGARLVTAFETEEGRTWAESKIKALTGGDKIAARFMRQDFFEFYPQFKLVIAGNQKPALRTVDEAIRRRFHLVPFRVVIPKHQRDPKLASKLKAEWPAIFRWMVEGCLAWQHNEKGLDPPELVIQATNEYLQQEDSIAAWADECCVRGGNHFETAAALFASWKGWADATGEQPGKRKDFKRKLAALGCVEARRNTARGYAGMKIMQPAAKPYQETDEDDDREPTEDIKTEF